MDLMRYSGVELSFDTEAVGAAINLGLDENHIQQEFHTDLYTSPIVTRSRAWTAQRIRSNAHII